MSTTDIDSITYDFKARIAVTFESVCPLEGFDVNQDLVSKFDSIFARAIKEYNERYSLMKLVLDASESADSSELVETSLNIISTDCSEVD